MNNFWDKLGISASAICILHCLSTPLLMLSLPAFSQFFSHGMFHLIVVAIVFPVAVVALWMGYRLHHLTQMLWIGALGLFSLCLAMIFELQNLGGPATLTMILAGILLSAAHLLNLRACRRAHGSPSLDPHKRPHGHSCGATVTHTAPGSSKP